MATKKVVVLGAGHGGSVCVSALNDIKGIDITVVERREASVHKFAGARALTQGSAFAKRTTIPNDKLVKEGKGNVLHGVIEKVTETEVILEDGSHIEFDYLICATGSVNAIGEPPLKIIKKSDMEDYYQDISTAIGKATKVLIIGGGPVAVELSGEIRDKYPETTIAMVNSHDTVLYNNPPFIKSFYKRINKQLEDKKIKTYLNTTVDLDFGQKPFIAGARTVTLSSGENVEVDLVIKAVGSKPSTSIYPDAWKNDQGRIKVNSSFQVENVPNVFAIGDINHVKETKMGYFAGVQGKHVAKSIAKLVKNPQASLAAYKPHPPLTFVPIGKYGGAVATPWLSLGEFAASNIKGKELFVSDGWKTYNKGSELKNHM